MGSNKVYLIYNRDEIIDADTQLNVSEELKHLKCYENFYLTLINKAYKEFLNTCDIDIDEDTLSHTRFNHDLGMRFLFLMNIFFKDSNSSLWIERNLFNNILLGEAILYTLHSILVNSDNKSIHILCNDRYRKIIDEDLTLYNIVLRRLFDLYLIDYKEDITKSKFMWNGYDFDFTFMKFKEDDNLYSLEWSPGFVYSLITEFFKDVF